MSDTGQTPTTNYLQRTELPEVTEAHRYISDPQIQSSNSHILLKIIAALLLGNMAFLGYIATILSKQSTVTNTSTSSLQSNTQTRNPNIEHAIDIKTNEVTEPQSEQNYIQAPSLPTPTIIVIHDGTDEAQLSALQEQITVMREKATDATNVALSNAYDIKRMADIQNIATTLLVYYMENDSLPPHFPTVLTCIGTDPECYDLYSHNELYFEKPILDPTIGTLGNTGYAIAQAGDASKIIRVHATGASGQSIEVLK